jgi:hypothetical protein
MLRKILLAALSTVVVAGCSTTYIEQLILEKDYQDMYVRGVFTWWEADENYRLKPLIEDTKVFAASAKLIADGQPYDFKFADENLTPGMSCGGADGENNVKLELKTPVQADCENPQGSFEYTPTETGTYQFVIDFTNEDMPQVYIQKTA